MGTTAIGKIRGALRVRWSSLVAMGLAMVLAAHAVAQAPAAAEVAQ